MSVRQRSAAAAFVVWTMFVWTQRMVNLVTGDESGASVVMSVISAVVLVGLAVGTAVVLVRARGADWEVPAGGSRRIVQCLAVLTISVWAVRGTLIVVDWRSTGFVAVHVGLAVVSVVLASMTWRAVTPLSELPLPVEPRSN